VSRAGGIPGVHAGEDVNWISCSLRRGGLGPLVAWNSGGDPSLATPCRIDVFTAAVLFREVRGVPQRADNVRTGKVRADLFVAVDASELDPGDFAAIFFCFVVALRVDSRDCFGKLPVSRYVNAGIASRAHPASSTPRTTRSPVPPVRTRSQCGTRTRTPRPRTPRTGTPRTDPQPVRPRTRTPRTGHRTYGIPVRVSPSASTDAPYATPATRPVRTPAYPLRTYAVPPPTASPYATAATNVCVSPRCATPTTRTDHARTARHRSHVIGGRARVTVDDG